MSKFIHLLYSPHTGLGLYGGFRGNRWLRNRIQIFKQFVAPSLQNQLTKDFVLWCSFRPEEKHNLYVQELMEYMQSIQEFKTVFTFHGPCFWDDKYPDDVARERLINSVHRSTGELLDTIGEVEYVYMTIQPSDDLYNKEAMLGIQKLLEGIDAAGFSMGYVMNYLTGELAEWNPDTNPPFYTIKFSRENFIDPLKHLQFTGPYKSHEYVKDFMSYATIRERGFLVGTHGENISTTFKHPFRGRVLEGSEREEILRKFGIFGVPNLKVRLSIRKKILHILPHAVQRKLRYLIGERFWQRIYEFLRG